MTVNGRSRFLIIKKIETGNARQRKWIRVALVYEYKID